MPIREIMNIREVDGKWVMNVEGLFNYLTAYAEGLDEGGREAKDQFRAAQWEMAASATRNLRDDLIKKTEAKERASKEWDALFKDKPHRVQDAPPSDGDDE